MSVITKNQAIQLLLDCLPDKLIPLFGSTTQASKILEQRLNLQNMLTITQDEKLTGLLGFYNRGQGFLNLSASALAVPVTPQQFYIEILCTAPAFRQQGIARLLLQQAEQQAKQIHCKSLVLDVWQHNYAALCLYRQAGFQLVGQHRAQAPLSHYTFLKMEKILF